MGAGYTVTALYEIVPRGGTCPDPGSTRSNTRRRFDACPVVRNNSNETLTLKIRWLLTDGKQAAVLSLVDREGPFSKASVDFRGHRLRSGMILRDSPYRGNATC